MLFHSGSHYLVRLWRNACTSRLFHQLGAAGIFHLAPEKGGRI